MLVTWFTMAITLDHFLSLHGYSFHLLSIFIWLPHFSTHWYSFSAPQLLMVVHGLSPPYFFPLLIADSGQIDGRFEEGEQSKKGEKAKENRSPKPQNMDGGEVRR